MSTKRKETDHGVRTAGTVTSGSQPGGKQLRAAIRVNKHFGKALPRPPEGSGRSDGAGRRHLLRPRVPPLSREATVGSLVLQPKS